MHPLEASRPGREVERGEESAAERLGRKHSYKEDEASSGEKEKWDVRGIAKRLKTDWGGMPEDLRRLTKGEGDSRGKRIRGEQWERKRNGGDPRLAWMQKADDDSEPPPLTPRERREIIDEESAEDSSVYTDLEEEDSDSDSDEEDEGFGELEGLRRGPGVSRTGSRRGGEAEGEMDGSTLGREARPLYEGLEPPRLSCGDRVNGQNKRQLRRENKIKRINKQLQQQQKSYWTSYKGEFELPEELEGAEVWLNQMCPQKLALRHPAEAKLL
eukprot:scaffold17443_cov38-Cyclotella_meneghiniana.AAC.10